MRKRLAVVALTTVLSSFGLFGFASPASASSCYIGDPPGAGDVYCIVFNEPLIRSLCLKLPVC